MINEFLSNTKSPSLMENSITIALVKEFRRRVSAREAVEGKEVILLVRVFVFVVVAVAPCVLDFAVGVDFLMVQVGRGGGG